MFHALPEKISILARMYVLATSESGPCTFDLTPDPQHGTKIGVEPVGVAPGSVRAQGFTLGREPHSGTRWTVILRLVVAATLWRQG